MKKKHIQRYINNFRRRISGNLRAGIGLTCNVYPSESGGAVLEFLLGTDLENDDIYKPVTSTTGKALQFIPQKAFGGDLTNVRFGGTNTILEPDRIILIKDDQHQEWTDRAAMSDVASIVSPSNSRSNS